MDITTYYFLYSVLATSTSMVETCISTPVAESTVVRVPVSPAAAAATVTTCLSSNVAPCTPPSNSAGLITNTLANDPDLYISSTLSPLVGTCTCTDNTIEHFSTSVANPANIGGENDGDISCMTTASFTPGIECVCTAAGECYKSSGFNLRFINLVPYCDVGGCFYYANLNCISPDANSGVVNIKTGALFQTCEQAALNPPVGSASFYIKAATFSCNGVCLPACYQCAGAFTPNDVAGDDGLANITRHKERPIAHQLAAARSKSDTSGGKGPRLPEL